MLKTRREKVGELLRISFSSKIIALIEINTYHTAETILYSYIDIFGIDKEILRIIKFYEEKSSMKLAITQLQNKEIPRDNWINSEIIVGEYLKDDSLVHNSNNSSNAILEWIR